MAADVIERETFTDAPQDRRAFPDGGPREDDSILIETGRGSETGAPRARVEGAV